MSFCTGKKSDGFFEYNVRKTNFTNSHQSEGSTSAIKDAGTERGPGVADF